MKNFTRATIKSIVKNGGATINQKGERVTLKSGYQVSKQDLVIVAVENFTKELLKKLILKLSCRGEYLGVWVDNGQVYIDISCRIATKTKAMTVGKQLNQLSVLRWKDCECLAVV